MKKLATLLIVFCMVLSGCGAPRSASNKNPPVKILLQRYVSVEAKAQGSPNASATVSGSRDVKRFQHILSSFTTRNGAYSDLVGAVYYDITVEQSDGTGGVDKRTYSVFRLTKSDYGMDTGDDKIHEYEDKNQAFDRLLKKYRVY